MTRSLTPRQQALLDAVRSYWAEHHFAPSMRDLMEQAGISSTSVTAYNLRVLREKGYVRFEDEITRSVTLVEHEALWRVWRTYAGRQVIEAMNAHS